MMAAMSVPAEAVDSRSREIDLGTLARCKAGDAMAFRAFVVRYERPVFALLSRMLGRGPEVEDLAQETFLRAFRALPRFDPAGSARPSTWLLTIATRLALDVRKRKRPETDVLTGSEPETRGSPEKDSSRAELRRALMDAIASLPDDQRAAFVLAEFHGFSLSEIGKALEAPENTVKTRLFRAREKLQRALSDFREEA